MNCRFDRDHDRSDPIWTPKLIEARLAEAAAVLRRLPGARIRGYFNIWPRYSYEFADLVEKAPRQTSMPSPSTGASAAFAAGSVRSNRRSSRGSAAMSSLSAFLTG